MEMLRGSHEKFRRISRSCAAASLFFILVGCRREADVCGRAQREGAIAWFHDDYANAKACATKSGLPLVVDLWAPWCHTCLSMQHYVLNDDALAQLARRFVWVALDTDKPENAESVGRFAPDVWPTYLVVSARDDALLARHLGSATLDQFMSFLVDGEQSHEATQGGGESAGAEPLRLLGEADRAAVAKDYPRAEAAYAAALRVGGAGWKRRPEVLVSLISTQWRREAWENCADLAREHLGDSGSGPSAVDFSYFGAECAAKLKDEARARSLQEALRVRLEALLVDPVTRLAVDDRSAGLEALRNLREQLGDAAGAHRAAEEQRALLDQAAKAAPTALAAMTFNWPRAEVYAYLGRPLELVQDLRTMMAQLPDQYDPPYRLAWIYLKGGQAEQALEPARKALELAYGPRKARVATLLADVQRARGDQMAERGALEQALRIYEALPPGQKQERSEAKLRETLATYIQ